MTLRGLQATTDKYGRYHISCAITPNESRGSNFVLKLDDRTLPSGFRTSTDLVQIKRATRGKTLQLNFGASIHRVVGIDFPMRCSSRVRPTSANSGGRGSTCSSRSWRKGRRYCDCLTSPTPRMRLWSNGAWKPSSDS